jgi:kynurenine formamidase
MTMKKYLLYLAWIMVPSCGQSQMLDLTYPFDEKTIYWPTEKGFSIQKIFYGITDKHYFYSAFKFCMPEHGGTHIDAPRHFSQTGRTVDEIPLEQFKGHAVVIDVHEAVEKNRDYAISVNDIRHFEHQYRRLSPQDIVIFYTGWGKYWGNKRAYLGSDKVGDVKHLHFPGLSKKAAEYLVSRRVKGVGLDTPSLDPGVSQTFWAHRVLLGANIYGLENMANIDQLDKIGRILIVSPLKIKGGSGGPARIYAE